MYLIASTKLRKAKSGLESTRPYFEALQGEIKRIFRTASDVDSRYFYPPEGRAAAQRHVRLPRHHGGQGPRGRV